MNADRPDPEETRAIPIPPPDGSTQFIKAPPAQGPHDVSRPRSTSTPPPPAESPKSLGAPRPGPAPSLGDAAPRGEEPWWQTIYRDRPPRPAPPPHETFSPPRPRPQQPPPTSPPPRAPIPPLPPPPAAAAPAGRVSRHAITAALAATVAVAAAVVAGIVLQHTAAAPTKVLDIAAAQQAVIRILSDPVDGYGATSVANVWCNNGINPTITQGAGFNCAVTVDGTPRQVAVVFQDNDGTYAVDRPR